MRPFPDKVMPEAWRAAGVFSSAIREAAFVAAEWVAVTVNAFNRISVLGRHPVRPRDPEGRIVR